MISNKNTSAEALDSGLTSSQRWPHPWVEKLQRFTDAVPDGLRLAYKKKKALISDAHDKPTIFGQVKHTSSQR
jgi:hypothetical protein